MGCGFFKQPRPGMTLIGRDHAKPEAPQTWCFRGLLPLLCWSGSGGGTKIWPGFSRDWGLLAARAVLWFFQISDFIRLSRKSRVASAGTIMIQWSYFLVAVCAAPLAGPSLSLQIILHHLSALQWRLFRNMVNYIASAAAWGLLLKPACFTTWGTHAM